MSQKATKRHRFNYVIDHERLSPEQHQTIQLLLAGKTVTEIANVLGKDRKTIYRWKRNPCFISLLNSYLSEIVDTTEIRLKGLVNKAVDVLEQQLAQGNLKAAIELLKIVNTYGNVQHGHMQTDPEAILQEDAESFADEELDKGFNGEYKMLKETYVATVKDRYQVGDTWDDFMEPEVETVVQPVNDNEERAHHEENTLCPGQ